jgi:hypothetical protein
MSVTTFGIRFLVLAFLVLPAGGAYAGAPEDGVPLAAEFAAGELRLLDNGDPHERFVGGALRFYISPRVSVGSEIAFSARRRYEHLMVTGNATFDFVGATAGGPRLVTPFAVVGGGLFRTTVDLPTGDVYSSSEGAFTAGGGARVRLARHVFVGAEMRVGWELHLRVNAMVGVQLGR